MDLNGADWEVQSELLQQPGLHNPIAACSLTEKAKGAARELF